MLSLTLCLWILVALFGFIGFMRLWQREILVTAAIILALFAWSSINKNNQLINLFAKPAADNASVEDKEKANTLRLTITSVPLLLMLLIGYSGPLLASGFRAGRFPNKPRSELQEGFVGFMLGALNGFLMLSSLLYYARTLGVLTDGPLIASGASILTAPAGGWDKFFFIQAAPLAVLSTFSLTLVFVVVVLFLLIALL